VFNIEIIFIVIIKSVLFIIYALSYSTQMLH